MLRCASTGGFLVLVSDKRYLRQRQIKRKNQLERIGSSLARRINKFKIQSYLYSPEPCAKVKNGEPVSKGKSFRQATFSRAEPALHCKVVFRP